MTEWTEAARKLAAEVTTDAPQWHEAVSATPRHLLVPRWWQPIPDSYPFAWQLVTPDDSRPWEQVYADETLTTQIGPLHADHATPTDRPIGAPTSSSTLPGLIVRMLHLLDPQPGERVLDVGTGSGYSAALLAHRLGDAAVTSIDLDKYLVDAARERLRMFGRAPRIQVADATGALPDDEYDRILATVSVRPVPPTWLKALRPSGRLVTTIANTSLLIAADMGNDGMARGRIQADPASFMPTRQAADYAPRLDDVYAVARDEPGEEICPLDGPIPDLWTNWQLRCLYELDSPDIEHRTATSDNGKMLLWLLAGDGSWARADEATGTIHQSGTRRLWDDLKRVEARWHEADRFPLHQLSVQLGPEECLVVSPDGRWMFRL